MEVYFGQAIKNQQLYAQKKILEMLGDRLILDSWESSIGQGITGVCEGSILEKGVVSTSTIEADALPIAATQIRPFLAGLPFHVEGISIVMHPNNPWVPTAHANIRKFSVKLGSGENFKWYGGGFDLTPYKPIKEICQMWHRNTKEYLDSFDDRLYFDWKKQCDEYFYLDHRNEARGIGGIFFDDYIGHEIYDEKMIIGLIDLFFDMFFNITSTLMDRSYTDDDKKFQEWRRGRYAEFNLLKDRGTQFGLKTQGRI
ncbi:MAG: coproporphyrinogen III oxidase, partial [Gammaproteobacteria bacterium]|nr:coproporphyrinogen III oxidase [Gammaproteobacteria bacterium]